MTRVSGYGISETYLVFFFRYLIGETSCYADLALFNVLLFSNARYAEAFQRMTCIPLLKVYMDRMKSLPSIAAYLKSGKCTYVLSQSNPRKTARDTSWFWPSGFHGNDFCSLLQHKNMSHSKMTYLMLWLMLRPLTSEAWVGFPVSVGEVVCGYQIGQAGYLCKWNFARPSPSGFVKRPRM